MVGMPDHRTSLLERHFFDAHGRASSCEFVSLAPRNGKLRAAKFFEARRPLSVHLSERDRGRRGKTKRQARANVIRRLGPIVALPRLSLLPAHITQRVVLQLNVRIKLLWLRRSHNRIHKRYLIGVSAATGLSGCLLEMRIETAASLRVIQTADAARDMMKMGWELGGESAARTPSTRSLNASARTRGRTAATGPKLHLTACFLGSLPGSLAVRVRCLCLPGRERKTTGERQHQMRKPLSVCGTR